MAKKIMTPEEYRAKIEKKKERRARFGKVFVKAIALLLGCAIVYCTSFIAFSRLGAAQGAASTQANSNSSSDDGWGDDWGDNGGTADNGNTA
ncbi:MAG: hypothetical protein K5761_06015, partial [Clostridiales bacterium]|nr:hypothetical protein [Clostridiales bacterium]